MQAGHQGVGGFGPAVSFQLTPSLGFGPLGEVRAGTEAAPLTTQDDHAHSSIRLVGIEQFEQTFQGGDVQRIALLGTVQGDAGDAVIDLAEQGGHGNPRLVVLL
ncbi:hypothetical protein D3C85_1581950 [compost metagenome]